jgi:hypothetical protein
MLLQELKEQIFKLPSSELTSQHLRDSYGALRYRKR